VDTAEELALSLRDGHAAWLAGRLEDAERHYRYVLALSPDHVEATSHLALTLRDAGRIRDALPFLLRATLLAPESAPLRARLGWAYLAEGLVEEARA
jgi:tetratricopeptide (TPR) repeat protein